MKNNNLAVSSVNYKRASKNNHAGIATPGGLDSPFTLSEENISNPDYDIYSDKSNRRFQDSKRKNKSKSSKKERLHST